MHSISGWLTRRWHAARDSPLTMLRFMATAFMVTVTVVVLLLTLLTGSARLLRLAGILWLFYGIILAAISYLDPALDELPHFLGDVGLSPAARGWSAIESQIARGNYDDAIEGLMVRAREPGVRVEATVRHAALLDREMNQPDAAAALLSGLPRRDLSPTDSYRVGMLLTELYERRLGDPGRAASELRRLADLSADPTRRAALLARLEQVKQTQANQGDVA